LKTESTTMNRAAPRALRPAAFCLAIACAFPAYAKTAPPCVKSLSPPRPWKRPLTVTTDPRAAAPAGARARRRRLPEEHPGFSVIRKGGTDGDPVFRGMAASRLNILLDGE
jgi:iron complex outermembrane receptor protein